MALSFPTNNAPYALLAIAIEAGQDPAAAFTLQPSVDASTAQTLIPKGSKQKISGAAALARFVARSFSKTLYDESNALQAGQQDVYLDLVRQTIATPKHMNALAELANSSSTTFLLNNDKPLLADFAVWGTVTAYTKSHSTLASLNDYPKFVAWMNKMNELASTKQAIAIVDKAVQEANDVAAKIAAEKAAGAATVEIPTIPGSDPETDPLDTFRNILAAQISKAINVDIKIIYDALEAPRQSENGDLALSVPRLRLKGNPAQFAKDIADKFVPNEYFIKAKNDGPFANFYINHIKLAQVLLPKVFEMKEKFGTNKTGAGKRCIVEFSSPNIAKPFHAGHLRSTIIGSYVRNVLAANGYDVTAMNYLGDWGKQYGLLAVGYSKYGSEAELAADPIKHLFDVYVKINADAKENEVIHDEARAYFKKMEDGDDEALALWKRFRDLSIVKYKEVYKRLNIEFDVYSGESQVTDGMNRALQMLKEKNMLTESEGALIIDLEKYKLGKCVVQKKDGTTLYITRDIGAAMERYEKYGFDHMYYVVAAQQDLHLKQLFKILELMGFEWAKKLTHFNFGLVGGMSTRKGTVVFLEDILEETRDSMHEVMKKNEAKYAQIENPLEVADNIGMSAIMIQDANARRIKNYDFDWKRMFSFEGDTGPYLQYAHARLCSIERKTGMEVNPKADLAKLDAEDPTRACTDLLVMIARFPAIVKDSTRAFEPVNIVGYAMKLSHTVSSALETMYVMGAEKDVAEARLLMYWAARITLGNAMRLLNLKPQERM